VTFINTAMLFGLTALLVPILIHLLNRSRAKVMDWGAMRFLLASLTSQNRRILIEEIILLILRCLLVGLVALAIARPFMPTRTRIPWAIVLPAVLGAMVCLAVAAAMWRQRRARYGLLAAAIALAVAAGAASAVEQIFQEFTWGSGTGERDIAIVLDASLSMTIRVDGRSNFERALAEARTVVASCRPGDAVSVILGGPVPRAVLGTPSPDPEAVGAALEEAKPVGGTMSVLESFNMAAATLAEGNNAAKTIVLITDGQNIGWDVKSKLRWRFLAEGLKNLPTQPNIVCRMLPLPKTYRNVAIADVAVSRKVVGSDRPVRVHVKVTNTGNVPVKPASVEFSVDGVRIAAEPVVTEIKPKATETVTFEHRFKDSGHRLLSARVVASDDLMADNESSRVLEVIDKLSVLIVDGAPSSHPLLGASSFIDVALTPRSEPDEDEEEKFKEDRVIEVEENLQLLVETEIVSAPEIADVGSFRDYGVVILANVPRLPDAVAERLVAYVEHGGGLLVAPGMRVKPTFYNAWTTTGARPVMPAKLGGRKSDLDGLARLEPRSFSHPALKSVIDSIESDAATALLREYWTLIPDENDSDVRVGGLLRTGEPFIVGRTLGKGRVLLTATSLDHRGSNLAALRCFVPLMHEMVYYLATPTMLEANVPPGSEVSLELRDRPSAGASGAGLMGEYYEGRNFGRLRGSRVDRQIDFKWGNRNPHPKLGRDSYSVRWTGWAVPAHGEKYDFRVTSDDGARLWVNGRQIVDAWRDRASEESRGSIDLPAGRRAKIKLEYYQGTSDADVKLEWSSRHQKRQVIPASALFPAWKGSDAPVDEGAAETADVLTPSQRILPAKLRQENGALRVSFGQTQEPGLYSLALPPDLARIYAPGSEGKGVPFVVLSRVEESSLDALSKADIAMAREHVGGDLFETEQTDEMTAKVAGGVPGEELWKYLVIGALLCLVAEIAVTRWIALQRRLNSTQEVVFGGDDVDVRTFRDRAHEMLAVPSNPTEGGSA